MSIGVTSGIEKPVIAEEAFASAYLIAKFGTTDEKVKKGAAALKPVLGIVQSKAKAGDKVNLMLTGISLVKLGGTVARGDLITTNDSAEGIKTITVKNYVVGIAMTSGVDGDLIPLLLSQGII